MLLLWVAAFVKAVDFEEISLGGGFLSWRPLLLFVIAFEVSSGLYLLIGDGVSSRRLMVTTFFVFSLVSGYAFLVDEDCGCMGASLQLDPLILLFLDIVFLLFFLCIKPLGHQTISSKKWLRIAPLLCASTGLATASIVAYVNQLQHIEMRVRHLVASEMVGKGWPLTRQIDKRLAPMETGTWLAIVVRKDCRDCIDLLSSNFSDPAEGPSDGRTATFIAGTRIWHFQFDKVSTEESDSRALQWPEGEPFVASPALFMVKNGLVVSAADGEEAFEFINRLRETW